jgi:hypothetical protein
VIQTSGQLMTILYHKTKECNKTYTHYYNKIIILLQYYNLVYLFPGNAQLLHILLLF